MEVQPAQKGAWDSRGAMTRQWGQLNVALGFQFPKSLKAAARLSTTLGIEKTIVLTEQYRNHRSVHMAVLIEHRPYVLDYFRL